MKVLNSKTADRAIDKLVMVIAISMVIFQMVSAHYLVVSSNSFLNLHLGFALLLVFLPILKEHRIRFLKLLMVLASIVCVFYVQLNMEYLELYSGSPQHPAVVVIIGTILIFLLVEGCRRYFGMALVGVILVFSIYPFIGCYLPGIFRTPGIRPIQILSRLGIGGIGESGIYGLILNMSAKAIFLFMVFGELLSATGGTRCFIQIGNILGRKMAGGAAMTSVTTSALLGTITGSVAANIATTGSFTIPMMKKAGYAPYQAGAIEAVASTGGQIMPPVMGYVAFLMVAFTGIPYLQVCAMCAIPAILYFLSIGCYVQFEALKRGRQPPKQKVDLRELLNFGPLFIVPLANLIILLAMRYPLDYSMSLTILILVGIALYRKATRPSLMQLMQGLTKGAIAGSQIAVVSAALGILLASMSMTQVLLKLPALVVSISGQNLIIALLLTMVVAFILGSGVSATASYILVALVIGPALIKMGLSLEQAHLFSFWFACLAYLTPPMAFGIFVATRIAHSKFWPTAIEAVKIVLGAFFIPYLMILCPIIILKTSTFTWDVLGFISSLIIIISLEIGAIGHYFTPIKGVGRVFYFTLPLMLVVAILLHTETLIVILVGIFIYATFAQWRGKGGRAGRETIT